MIVLGKTALRPEDSVSTGVGGSAVGGNGLGESKVVCARVGIAGGGVGTVLGVAVGPHAVSSRMVTVVLMKRYRMRYFLLPLLGALSSSRAGKVFTVWQYKDADWKQKVPPAKERDHISIQRSLNLPQVP
jgi:hypothetical protein